MKDLDLNKTYTYADYLGWFFEERIELIKGKIFKMSPAPNAYHQEISTSLILRIGYFLKNKGCKVYHAPFDVRLPKPGGKSRDENISTVVQPDISVICDKNKIDQKGCLGPPDWIIEILSPSTSKKDRTDKFELYQSSGVKEYWIVFPKKQQIKAYSLNEKGKYEEFGSFQKEEAIYSALFPELRIDLQPIFPELDLSEEPWEENYVRL